MRDILVTFELTAMWIYGVYSQDRLWMPRPEFNYLSYSYWFEFGALVFALFASKFYILKIEIIFNDLIRCIICY